MKRITLALALLLLLAPTAGFAVTHAAGGLGFHRDEAPIGIRWWMGSTQKVGIDIGLGLDTNEESDLESVDPSDNTSLVDFTFEGGIPIVMKSWERAHVLFRPGVAFTSDQEFVQTGATTYEKDRASRVAVSAEVEAELFLAPRLRGSDRQSSRRGGQHHGVRDVRRRLHERRVPRVHLGGRRVGPPGALGGFAPGAGFDRSSRSARPLERVSRGRSVECLAARNSGTVVD